MKRLGFIQFVLCAALCHQVHAQRAAPVSQATSVAGGSAALRSFSDRFSQQVNVKDYGALGNTRTDLASTVNISASSSSLTISGSDFLSSDVGKTIIVDGAGVVSTDGKVTAIPVSAAGSAYAATPTVSLSNTGSGTGAVALAKMTLISGTVATGGTGCTNGAQTFTLSGGTTFSGLSSFQGVAAQVTGTVSGGVLGGALTVAVAGSYLPGTATTTLLASAPALTGGGCATAPTLTPSWGVGGIFMAGQGIHYPLNGVTAALSGGSATLGTPTVSTVTAPLVATITTVADASHITLASPATTAVSAVVAVTWGFDDTPAFLLAYTRMVTLAASGYHPVLYLPASSYLLRQGMPTNYQLSFSIEGDGRYRTYITVSPEMSGPEFSWSDAWLGGGAYPSSGPTGSPTTSYAGPTVQGLTIFGDLTSANEQDAFVFYDRADQVHIRDVAVYYLPGRCFRTGVTLNTSQSYMRESRFDDLYCANMGLAGVPVIDFDTQGSGDATNDFTGVNVNMWDIRGPGVVIRSNNTVKGTTLIKFFGLRIEGGIAGATGDGLQIGDATETGTVSNVVIYGGELTNVSPGANALSVLSQAIAYNPFNIRYEGVIQLSGGGGLNIQAGRSMQFILQGLGANGTSVTLGGHVGGAIKLDANGSESSLTYANSTTASLFTPLLGVIVPNSTGIVGNVHDGSAAGGNTTGPNSVDLQTNRVLATQVAGASGSVLIGGNQNQINVSANNAAIVGGAQNALSGQLSFSGGGKGIQDNGAFAWNCYSSGGIVTPGDSETCYTTLKGTTSDTSTVRLVSDVAGGSANGTNCVNMTAAGQYALTIKLSAFDVTTPANSITWVQPLGQLYRGATAGTTVYNPGTPMTIPASLPAGVAITEAADATANACYNLSFKAPSGNTDTWRITAAVEFTRTR